MPITAPPPEQPFPNLSRQASKMMEQLQKGFFYPSESWTPNVNLYETANGYLVCVDLAGVDKEKIDVEVIDQRLQLRFGDAADTPEQDQMLASGHEIELKERERKQEK